MFNTFRMVPQISRWIFHLFNRSFLDCLNGQRPIGFSERRFRLEEGLRLGYLGFGFGPAIGRLVAA